MGKKLEVNINISKLKCERCGYEWYPRQEKVKICPKCKSAYWDTPKKKVDDAEVSE